MRGRVVHALLEWSEANGWREPPPELAQEEMAVEGLDSESADLVEEILAPVRGWLGSPLLRERLGKGARTRAEVPILLAAGGTVLRGSIDLLVEREGEPPLVVDYKTDRLDGAAPAEHAERYDTQRSIYALATAQALGAEEVEVAYVFLEHPDDPILAVMDATKMDAGRERLEATISQITAGEFPVAAPEKRSWALCRGCPALGSLCRGPNE